MSSLSLKISGKKFDFFNSFELSLIYNSIASVFSFEGLSFTDEQKELFKPLQYKRAKVYFNDELLLTGTILNTSTAVENQQSLASISGYSIAGVLEDCEIPIELYPLQSDKLTIKEIIEKVIWPFGVKLNVDPEVQSLISKKYDKSTADADQTIKDYFTELSTQKNIVLSHNENGDLVLTKTKANLKPFALFDENMPSTKISLSVDGQSVHSKITVQKQSSLDTNVSGEETINNDIITVYRPTVKSQSSGDNSDTINAANMILASEMRAINLTINTDRWVWFDGKKEQIIKPNQIIEVLSPSNFINTKTKFFIEKVDFVGNNEGTTATLSCVLPECYNGEKFKNIFE